VPEIALSLCGNLDHQDARISNDMFNRDLITHEALCENPALLSDPNLVVRVGSRCIKRCSNVEILCHNMCISLVVCHVYILKTLEQLIGVILPAKAREYVFTGVGLSVCLCVCL